MKPLAVLARLDWWVVLAAASIALAGAVIVHSATLDQPRLAAKHVLVLGIGAASAIVVIAVPYTKVRRHAGWLYALAVLALVGLPWFGITVNGARRWYRLPGFFVQPSEVAKLAVIIALAAYLRFRTKTKTLEGLLIPLAIAGLPALLIMRQPDLGSALVFGPVLLAMCAAAGAPARSIWTLIGVGVVLAPLSYLVLHDYQQDRIDVWLQHFTWGAGAEHDPDVAAILRDRGYQPWQALIAIGSGGWLGFGLTEGPQNRYGFLPYRYDDYIFAVVAEETGFVGAVGLLALFGLLVCGLLRIALRTRERFGRLLAVGVAAYFATQSLIHAAVCIWLIPATGLPMPLVSYGGSSAVVSCWALALALNVGVRHEPVLGSDGFR